MPTFDYTCPKCGKTVEDFQHTIAKKAKSLQCVCGGRMLPQVPAPRAIKIDGATSVMVKFRNQIAKPFYDDQRMSVGDKARRNLERRVYKQRHLEGKSPTTIVMP